MAVSLSVILRRTIPWLAFLLAVPAAAQVSGQSFQVTPETSSVTVGDSVTLRFRVRLEDTDLLFDTIPEPVGSLPPGVRVLSVEKLTRTPDRLFHGRAHVTFYRPGRQPVPTFGLPFMRAVKGVERATLASDSAFVDVVALLPAGNPDLRDIKPLEPRAGPPLLPYTLALLIAGAGGVYYIQRRRRRKSRVDILPLTPPEKPLERGPYEIALERLAGVERDSWPSQGEVAIHYEAIVNVLREYLEDAHTVAARECTTSELLWTLPPHLTAAGLRERCHDLLSEADLVKFAKLQPGVASAAGFLARSRQLLQAWHEAVSVDESIDALR